MNKLIASILTALALLLNSHTTRAQDSTASPKDSAKQLAAVSVTAAKPYIIQHTDKIIINITQSPLAAGGNAYEAVKRVPGIIDLQGLQFRGRQVTVFMDDRPVRLSGEELQNYLSAIPAGAIDRIEILPHPTSKYEANGGVVINIISARSKDMGANGAFTAGAGAGRYGRYNTGLNLNYRSKKLSLYGSYDLLYTKVRNNSTTTRQFNDAYKIFEDQSALSQASNHTFRIGFDYTINKNSSFGILIRGALSSRNKDITNVSRQHYETRDTFSTVTTVNHNQYFTPSVNLYYKIKGLTINADYFSYVKDWRDDFTTRFTNEKNEEYRTAYLLKDNSPARNTSRSLSADYAFHLGKIRYETGLKTILTHTDNDVAWETFDGNSWTNDPARSNHFIYNENIYAAYLNLTRTLGKLTLQTGLRAEHTYTNGNSVTLKQERTNRYTNLFPNLNITYTPTDDHQFSFSYSRNIERYGFSIVNPFIIYQSQYAYYQGNPNIKPSFYHNFELSWAYRNEWMASFGYSHYVDVPAEIYKKDPGGNAVISTYDNVSSADQLTFNLTWTKSLLRGRLSTSNTLGGLHAGYHAPASTGLNNTSYTAYLSSNNRVLFNHGWKAEINADYYSPMAVGAYSFRSQFEMGAGLSKNILKNKGTLTLNVTDIFNTSKRRYTTSSFGTTCLTRDNPETRFVKLVFTYKFGNSQVKAARTRQTGLDEIKNRMN
ncbi:MAG: TonB-dependent receptor [Chitinophagaceae bacterium]|nr:TonB-dependent receptor [Chitinophagaceae bacterium]